MKLTGTKTIEVEVEVSAWEMLKGLYWECGLGAVYESKTNPKKLWKLDDDGVLYETKDISYHGSPKYKLTGKTITDPKKLKAYHVLEQLIDIVRDIENEQ